MSTRASRRALARRRFSLLAGSLARDFLPRRRSPLACLRFCLECSCASKLPQRGPKPIPYRHPCTSAGRPCLTGPFVLLCLEATLSLFAFVPARPLGYSTYPLCSPKWNPAKPPGAWADQGLHFPARRPSRENPYRRAGRRLQQDLPSLVLLHFSESQRTTARGARKRVEVRLRPRIWLFRPKRSSS